MTTIVTRAGKGSTLSHVEMDANLNNLNNDKSETTHTHTGVYQPASANLDEYAAVNPTTAGLALLDDATASDQLTTLGVSTYMKGLLDDANEATLKASINLEPGVDVLAYVAPSTSGNVLTSNGSAWTSTAPLSIASTAEAQAGSDNTKAISSLRMREGFNATGSAPVYACRAWVNFDGTGTVAIRASGNVSSITDNGAGLYTVNFTTAMPDSNYAALCSVNSFTIAAAVATKTTVTTTSCGVTTTNSTAFADYSEVSVAIFR